MKILLVASDNCNTSGAFLCMVQLAKHLKYDLNNDLRIVVPFEGSGSKLLKEIGIDFDVVYSPDWVSPSLIKHPLRALKSYYNFFKASKYESNILRYLNEYRPDIVHINTSWCFLFGKVAMKNNFPVVWQVQEFLYEDQGMHFINKNFSLKTFHNANVVATISNAINEKYLGYGLNNTKIVLDGLDVSKYYNESHLIFNNHKIVFLFVGGVGKKKGQFELLEWIGKYNNQNNIGDFEFRIVGGCTPKYKAMLEKISGKYNINNKVIIVGAKSNVMEEYLNSDIQFVNSKKEAFGRVTVEGILSGCCVLASNSGGSKEIIQNGINGYLYNQGDFISFSNTLSYVLENKKKVQKNIHNGQVITKNKFDSLRNAEDFFHIYKNIKEGNND